MRRLPFFGGSAATFDTVVPEPEDPITVIHAWVGNVSDDGATVKFRSTDAAEAVLHWSTASDLSSPTSVVATEGNDDVWTANLTGLPTDDTIYWGFPGHAAFGINSFRTFPTDGTADTFLIALGGDTGSSPTYPGPGDTSNSPAFDRIRDHDPEFFWMLGDLHYDNNNTTNPAIYRQSFKDVIANARFAQLIREVPTLYMWDDHDYGPNNAGGSYSGKATAAQVYREYVPHWPLAVSDGIYKSFVRGRVRFIDLDCRYFKSANGATDNSSKTRLGTTQKAWFKAELLAATEPLIVVNVVSWFGVTTSFSDGWQGFTTERQELAEFFEDNALTSRLLLVGADIHELQYDDGTNTQFDPDAVTPGPPYAGFAPLDCSFNHFAATCQQAFQTRKQQYGTILFTDTGTQITARLRGYALSSSPGSTSSVQFDESIVYPG